MNINILEQMARKALKGDAIESRSMLTSGVITPAEHRSIESLSSQIAANVHVMSGNPSTGVVALRGINIRWL